MQCDSVRCRALCKFEKNWLRMRKEIFQFIGVLLWFSLSVLVGVYWKGKGRSFVTGFGSGVFLSPLIGYIIGLCIKPEEKT